MIIIVKLLLPGARGFPIAFPSGLSLLIAKSDPYVRVKLGPEPKVMIDILGATRIITQLSSKTSTPTATPTSSMPLVDYSSSEAEAEEDDISKPDLPPKRSSPNQATTSLPPLPQHSPHPPLPPLPATFHDLYSTNTRTGTSDDPALHGGRKRQIPHVQGNWPSHVYLECEFPHPSQSKLA